MTRKEGFEAGEQIAREFLIPLRDKTYPSYAGVLDLATRLGLVSLRVFPIQLPTDDNGTLAVVTARAEFSDDTVWEDVGDASPRSTSPQMAPAVLRLASCVPLSAQALTRRGWTGKDDLAIGEEILAYDIERDELRWTPLLEITTTDERVPTLQMTSRCFSACCTANHSWVTANQGCSRRLVATEALGNHAIRVSAPAESGDHPLTAQEAAILGWLATDGSVQMKKVGRYGPYLRAKINQSKPHMVVELSKLLAGLAHVHVYAVKDRDFGSYVSTCLPQYTFELRAEFVRELLTKAGLYEKGALLPWTELTPLVLSLSADARQAMMSAMLKGDGSGRTQGRGWTFGKKRKPGVMEAFELLATLQGFALGLPKDGNSRPIRSVRSWRTITASYLSVQPGPAQVVWCPTTEFGTWLMRDQGQITITGNTRAKGRVLRSACNVNEETFEDVESSAGVAAGRSERAPASGPQTRKAASGGPPACSWPDCGLILTQRQMTVSRKRTGQNYCEGHLPQAEAALSRKIAGRPAV